jgi:hypothetical protein
VGLGSQRAASPHWSSRRGPGQRRQGPRPGSGHLPPVLRVDEREIPGRDRSKRAEPVASGTQHAGTQGAQGSGDGDASAARPQPARPARGGQCNQPGRPGAPCPSQDTVYYAGLALPRPVASRAPPLKGVLVSPAAPPAGLFWAYSAGHNSPSAAVMSVAWSIYLPTGSEALRATAVGQKWTPTVSRAHFCSVAISAGS